MGRFANIWAFVLFIGTIFTVTALGRGYQPPANNKLSRIKKKSASIPKRKKYDRLDGAGKSGKKVDFIEWAGNIEIHIYPAGTIKGLALRIDKPAKGKKVMVVGYRFGDNPAKQYIRRNTFSVPVQEGFHVYKDPKAVEYDKFVVTNHQLDAPLIAYALEPQPKQLYPDGHPVLIKKESKEKHPSPARMPTHHKGHPKKNPVDENGSIKPFSW